MTTLDNIESLNQISSDESNKKLSLDNFNDTSTQQYRLYFNREWTLWQTPKPDNTNRSNQLQLNTNKAAQESLVKNIASFSNSDEMWGIQCQVSKPNNLQSGSSQHLFEKGVKPMWEDEINKNGGRWQLRLKKSLADRYWEGLFLAVVGEYDKWADINDITGIVISCKWNEDIIQVWNKNGHDVNIRNNIRKMMKDILYLSESTVMEYKTHPNKEQKNSQQLTCYANGKERKSSIEEANYNNSYNKSYDKHNQKNMDANYWGGDRKYKDDRNNYNKEQDNSKSKVEDWSQQKANYNNNMRSKKWQRRDNYETENYWGRDRKYYENNEKQQGNKESQDKRNFKRDNFKRKDDADKKQ